MLIRKECSKIRSCIVDSKSAEKFENSDFVTQTTIENSVVKFNNKKIMKLISKFDRHLDSTQKKLLHQEYKENIKKQWILLSKIVDRLFLYFFILMTFFILGGIINSAPNAEFF